MHVIRVRNVQEALPIGIKELHSRGLPMSSRAGDVIVHPMPVTTIYNRPTERVIFHPQRDANPFFHLFEGLWMLAGRDDGRFLDRFVKDFSKRFSDYSEEPGKPIHGAYGNRWDIGDQLYKLEIYLKNNPFGRRAVLQIWNHEDDLHTDEHLKDVPCNTQTYFWNSAGRLNMTVTCRSNDIIWGAYGANAVHFSMLQEYMAAKIGWDVGYYWQVSNNFHAYSNILKKLSILEPMADPYEGGTVKPFPLVSVPEIWDRDLLLFLEDPTSNGYEDPFFHHVAKPMWWAHAAFLKREDPDRFAKALEILDQCQASDWKLAASEWIHRRAVKGE